MVGTGTATPLHVVLAVYNEDLQWIDEAFSDVCKSFDITYYVYRKDAGALGPRGSLAAGALGPRGSLAAGALGPRGSLAAGALSSTAHAVVEEHLPNLGREGDTYLHHILKHFDKIDNDNDNVRNDDDGGVVTLFLQGKIEDHVNMFYRPHTPRSFVNALVRDTLAHGLSVNTADAHRVGYNSARPGFRFRGKGVQPSSKYANMGEWFHHHFGRPMPCDNDSSNGGITTMRWWVSALFGVKTNMFRVRKRVFYENLKRDLQSINPEEGHYMERAWLAVFQML
jgi:hypothetical protein